MSNTNTDTLVEALIEEYTNPVTLTQEEQERVESYKSIIGQATEDYFKRYKIEGWKLAYSNIGGSHGRCNYTTKTITINRTTMHIRPLLAMLNTLAHEVAHILTRGHGHDKVWAAKARELGMVNPTACTGDDNLDTPENMLATMRARKARWYLVSEDSKRVLGGWSRKPKYTDGYSHPRFPQEGKNLRVVRATEWEKAEDLRIASSDMDSIWEKLA